MREFLSWFVVSTGLGSVGVWLVMKVAMKMGWLDVPNERSFHNVPVPRIGGIGILLPVVVCLTLILLLDGNSSTAWLGALLPALLIGAVSLLDDRFELPRALRFGGHLIAAAAVIYLLRAAWAGAPWPLLGGLPVVVAGALLLLWMTGLTNSYNFMDGIDGIAAIQGLVAVLGWFTVLQFECADPLAGPQALILVCLAGGLAGFLVLNWAPASIFMGDIGSTFLGFYLAALPLVAAAHGIPLDRALEAGALFTWPFIIDTGVTFTRRLVRRERIFDAHRSHLYQVLAGTFDERRWGHRATSSLFGLLALLGVALYWTSGPLWAKLAVLAGVWVALTAWTYGIRVKNPPAPANSLSTAGSAAPEDRALEKPRLASMPFDIYLSPPEITDAEHRLVTEALASGFIAPVGPQVNDFESGLSSHLGLDGLLALSSGTAAIHLGLRALGVGPGDCVLTPDLTFIASVNPIRYLGAEPVLIDVRDDNWAIDPELARQAIRTLRQEGRMVRAMVVVHAFGVPADMDQLMRLAREEQVAVLEDCAGAFGATWGGKPVGSFGDAAAYSFNGNKVLTTSGGGALYVRNPEMRKAARIWANQGRRHGTVGYQYETMGYNYKLSNICAAIGVAQLETLAGRLERKRRIFQTYRAQLADIPGILFLPEPAHGCNNYWLTSIGLGSHAEVDSVVMGLREQGIEASPMWRPMHEQGLNHELRLFGGEVSTRIHQRFLSLPSGSALTAAQQARVCAAVRAQLQVAS